MIFGIGTDIVMVSRFDEFLLRHGVRGLDKLLAPEERDDCLASKDPGRFLAKRFAAKEALGKALGTGIRTPVLLTSIAVVHDDFGKPTFRCAPSVEAMLEGRQLNTHLSISDEREFAVAFVVLEKM